MFRFNLRALVGCLTTRESRPENGFESLTYVVLLIYFLGNQTDSAVDRWSPDMITFKRLCP